MDEKYKHMYIGELQGLQRRINFLKKTNETAREPSMENAIDILRNSQERVFILE